MTQAMESIQEALGAPMSVRMNQVRVLLEQIEDMKRKILKVQFDENLAYAEKTQQLEDMQRALLQAEHIAVNLMQSELSLASTGEKDGDGDGHDGQEDDND